MAKQRRTGLSGGLRNPAERQEAGKNKACFERNPASWETKMENFPKYVRRQNLTRFMALYEIFKRVLQVKGSIVECGVHQGFGLMTWAKLSAILEPANMTRRIYGFDTFEGFPAVSARDRGKASKHVKAGGLAADTFDELQALAEIHDSTRYLGHIAKVELIKGNAVETIPGFLEEHPHLVVSLLFMDFDLYEPTRVALEHFIGRMPKGAVVAFDELDNPLWPGESQAMLEFFEDNKLRLKRLDFDPYIAFAEID
ncbi:MAG: class I SAM-dependent methyltransferase [SAR324 cluster bacterium]|nr:class I SAM-dependent methyltransferase [SAR324 cluster bacterium]MCZ6558752.1 class I SAM-dependent methyltransferase [SAR324 cluster bacterium]